MSIIFDLPYSGGRPFLGISRSQIMVRVESCFLKCCPLSTQWRGSVLQQVLMYIVPTPETPWVDAAKEHQVWRGLDTKGHSKYLWSRGVIYSSWLLPRGVLKWKRFP